ncbi:hypothetical protein BD560DRAFT_435715 [Blakeslea trispora]|nr:hypothetical protein BD560DRAFT_435715 [Blakeslea trispora]
MPAIEKPGNNENQDDSQAKEKVDAKIERSLRPVTIKQVLNALIEEDRFFIDGICINGKIRYITQLEGYSTVCIEDGTGSIDLKVDGEASLEPGDDVLQVLSLIK